MDTNATTTTTDTALKTSKVTPKRSAIDKRSLAELQAAQEILQAAQEPAHAAALAEGGITPALLTQLADAIPRCQGLFTGSVDEREHRKNNTQQESVTVSRLRRLVRGVQTAARLKYADEPASDNHLGHYYIGERITLSRARLATYTAGILQKLETDTLPGISAARVAELKSTYDTWQALNAAQSVAQEAAAQRRQEGLSELERIKESRRRIQRAADVVFPVGDPAHFAARASFHLESNKPFRG